MLGFDINSLGAPIAQLVLSKGLGLPPLQWQQRANKLNKKQLDEVPTQALFPGRTIQQTAESAAVRAGLYLWHGFLKDCLAICATPGCIDHLYWQGICCRHAAQPDAAKKIFQRVERHPVYAQLLPHCRELIGLGTDRPLKRFLDTINQVDGFEPYAFIDLYEMARLGNTCEATHKLICSIQAVEFGLLLKHCHDQACLAPAGVGA
jgi:hypothetical protein